MKFGQSLRRVMAVVIAVGILQGCGEGQALPPSDAKATPPPEPDKSAQAAIKRNKKAKGVPTSTRGQGPAPAAE